MNQWPFRPEGPSHGTEDPDPPEESFPVVSSMECTGLIPSLPLSPSEMDSYGSIYDIPLPHETPHSTGTSSHAAQK